MKIFVSTGEVSGDLHLSYLVKEAKELDKNVSFMEWQANTLKMQELI